MYEQPWNTRLVNRLSSTNNRSGGSLQKISSIQETKQYCPSIPFPMVSSCRHGHTEGMIITKKIKNSFFCRIEFNNDPIDRYL
jgi:hypothetical protein